MSRLDLCANTDCRHLESAHLSTIQKVVDPKVAGAFRAVVRICAVEGCGCRNYQQPAPRSASPPIEPER